MLVFDKDYNLVDLAYEQLNATYSQPVGNGTKLPMGQLSVTLPIKEPGYVYIYISNEGSTQQDIYFDDMKITHQKSPVIQMDDYFPFGLMYNSYQRENSVPNTSRFQGQAHIDDLDLGWNLFKWRYQDPSIGRFFTVDPMSRAFYYNSPYSFSENKVTTHVELEGLEAFFIHGARSSSDVWTDDLVKFIKTELTTNETEKVKFNWNEEVGRYKWGPRKRNWLANKESDRMIAAKSLVAYVMNNMNPGENITLIGHSHGGNVAILAAKLLWEKHGIQVDIVNFNTPAYNGDDDPENPEANKGIRTLIHFYTKQDGVAGFWAGSDKYSTNQPNIKNIMLSNPLSKGWLSFHFMENVNLGEVKQKKPDYDKRARKRSGG
jgi:RHS repeat-associated protein